MALEWLIDLLKDWVKLYFKGMIVIWSGTLATIPDGWALCDGTNGTPDFRARFIRQVFPTFINPGDIGGSVSHQHDFTSDGHQHGVDPHAHSFAGDGHRHTLISGTDIAAGSDYDKLTQVNDAIGTTDPSSPDTDEQVDTGETDLAAHLPLFYALAFIIKL